MTQIPRILVIGYCYPPTASPEAFVSAKLLRNIPDCEIDVLTLEDGLVSDFRDAEMGEYGSKINGNVIKVSPPRLIKWLCRLPRLPLRPDRWLLANHSVRKRAVELLADRYDLLVTRSQYHSAHLVGLKLKAMRPDLPWIACFSDPWSKADHQTDVPLFSYLSRNLEQRVLKNADHLVFPTKGLLRHMTEDKDNAALKSSVIPHCFDPSLYQERPHRQTLSRSKLQYTWRIFGSFYGNRQPDILLQSLRKIRIPNNIFLTIEIFGSYHDTYGRFKAFNNTQKDRRIVYGGQISHKSALSLMQDSDLLIVIDSTDNQESFYLPSKIVDYFGSGKPVLSICRPGTVKQITQERGDLVADIDSADSICNSMEIALSRTHKGERKINSTLNFAGTIVGPKFRSLIQKTIDDYHNEYR
ncbi:glycosyltransferase [Thalassospira tepidiphila]|uniref:glycosyltransferase n=1 Tax=Thalassospira tepidiphila TaxID=393657 RepID=UPI003AA7DD71